MKKPKITLTIKKEDSGYSAHTLVQNVSINTQGETFSELKEMAIDAVNLAFVDKGFNYKIEELKFVLDLQSFFDFYKVINAKALSERIGMNQSLLAQYIKGNKRPSPAQTKRILEGVRKIGKELSEIQFLI